MSLALNATGSLLKIAATASATTFNTIPETHKINAPNVKFDLIDVTSHDSTGGFREFLPGLADGENVTSEFFFVPTNTIHIQMRTDAYAKTKRTFRIIFTDTGAGNQMDFSAYIVGLQPVANIGDALRSSLTGKVTGQPTWT